jgi:hypothetical protein
LFCILFCILFSFLILQHISHVYPFSVRQGIRSNVSWLNPCRPGSNRQGECCMLCAVCCVLCAWCE